MTLDRSKFLTLMLGGQLAAAGGLLVPGASADTLETPSEIPASPVLECVEWDSTGECVRWAPAMECVEWDATGECVRFEDR